MTYIHVVQGHVGRGKSVVLAFADMITKSKKAQTCKTCKLSLQSICIVVMFDWFATCWKLRSHQILPDMSSHSLTMIRLNTRPLHIQKDRQGQDLSFTPADPPWRLKCLCQVSKWKAITANVAVIKLKSFHRLFKCYLARSCWTWLNMFGFKASVLIPRPSALLIEVNNHLGSRNYVG